MKWIEISAMRVLAVTDSELSSDFEQLDENGQKCGYYQTPVLIRRLSDQKIFKLANIVPAANDEKYVKYLEEL